MLDSIKANGLDIAKRAAKTAVQAFAAVLLASNEPLSKTALLAGVAAGISAVWNSVLAVKPVAKPAPKTSKK